MHALTDGLATLQDRDEHGTRLHQLLAGIDEGGGEVASGIQTQLQVDHRVEGSEVYDDLRGLLGAAIHEVQLFQGSLVEEGQQGLALIPLQAKL